MDINKLSREEFVEYAKNFGIWRAYDYPEWLEEKQKILERMTELGVTMNEITTRQIPDVSDVRYIKNMLR